jgi:molybdenum cofactor biosynthesis enzyme MoaA
MQQKADPDIVRTRKRALTRRGVMWLGQTCNQRCYFCYFIDRIEDHNHPQHAFMSLEKAKRITTTLRNFYGNRSIDIQGGEPTIYKDIFALVRHCREIGLIPTLITNGLVLNRPGVLEQYRDAGLRDFLVSLHGIEDVHDEVVGVKGAYGKIIGSIERMRELNIPFRFNCTMSKPVVPIIPEVAEKAVLYGALAVNFIAFNPFSDQNAGHRRADTVARYSEIKTQLTRAIDLLEAAGIEVNVRYLPLCMAEKRHRKNFYNFQMLSYDVHEWDYQSWLWTMMSTQMMHEGNPLPPMKLGAGCRRIYKAPADKMRDHYERRPVIQGAKFKAQHVLASLQQLALGRDAMYRREAQVRASLDCDYKYGDACTRCNLRSICDGFHGDYAQFFGTGEAVSVTDVPHTEDPLTFVREQEKVILAEDCEWAL